MLCAVGLNFYSAAYLVCICFYPTRFAPIHQFFFVPLCDPSLCLALTLYVRLFLSLSVLLSLPRSFPTFHPSPDYVCVHFVLMVFVYLKECLKLQKKKLVGEIHNFL